MTDKWFSHETAIIDEGAEIGKRSKIWHFSHVCARAIIGQDCQLGQNVYIDNLAQIGDRVKIQNNVSVYARVVIEDDVFCGPSVVFTNVVNPRAFIERKDEFQTTLVRQGASLGANSTIVCGVTLGAYCLVGAGATVATDVTDYALMLGIPARQVGWVSKAGHRLPLPVTGEGVADCKESNERYYLRGDKLNAQPLID
ncbi:N-acetyltransferase [Planctobacterium marinum]|uniref:N-acetyltransferase n=1 Tax=Planctobacterium marinum TaxID=1631968 RepID=A0AA48HM46_9ALTE|nr:N-acetyltransferase [Planctobacterium marinum]